ncbi:MAG: hypothetical protein AB3N28_09510 [Kordiimonas sp.]
MPEYRLVKYTRISGKEVRTAIFIAAPGLLFPNEGREQFLGEKQETIMTTTSKEAAIEAWQRFHKVLSEEEYLELKTGRLGTKTANLEVCERYLNIKNKFQTGLFIQNPITKRVEKTVSIFLDKDSTAAKRTDSALQSYENDTRVKQNLTYFEL